MTQVKNKYLEKVAFIGNIAGAMGAKPGDKVGGALIGGTVGGAVGGSVGLTAGTLASKALKSAHGGLAVAGALGGGAIGGFYGGKAYSNIKKNVQGSNYHKKEAEFTQPDTDEKLKKDVASIGKVKLDAVQGKDNGPGKGACTPDKECLDKAAGIVDSILSSKGAGKIANAGIKGFGAAKSAIGGASKATKIGLGLGAAGVGVGAAAAAIPKNNQQ